MARRVGEELVRKAMQDGEDLEESMKTTIKRRAEVKLPITRRSGIVGEGVGNVEESVKAQACSGFRETKEKTEAALKRYADAWKILPPKALGEVKDANTKAIAAASRKNNDAQAAWHNAEDAFDEVWEQTSPETFAALSDLKAEAQRMGQNVEHLRGHFSCYRKKKHAQDMFKSRLFVNDRAMSFAKEKYTECRGSLPESLANAIHRYEEAESAYVAEHKHAYDLLLEVVATAYRTNHSGEEQFFWRFGVALENLRGALMRRSCFDDSPEHHEIVDELKKNSELSDADRKPFDGVDDLVEHWKSTKGLCVAKELALRKYSVCFWEEDHDEEGPDPWELEEQVLSESGLPGGIF